ncbi:putative glycoside hydrolase [Fervidobacterium sp.]
MTIRNRKSEKNYEKVNKMYKLSQQGKLMVERIRKTKLKVSIVAAVLFIVSSFIFFSLLFSEGGSFKSTKFTLSATPNTVDSSPTTNPLPQTTSTDTENHDSEGTADDSSVSINISDDSSSTLIELTQVSTNNLYTATNNEIEPKVATTELSVEIPSQDTNTNQSLMPEEIQETTTTQSQYYYVNQFNLSVFDSPEMNKVKDTLRYGTYVIKLSETTVNNGTNLTKIEYNTKSGKSVGWVRSASLTDSLKSITGEDYEELSFIPMKKVEARISDVRGIYLTRYSVPNKTKINEWVSFAKSTNINTFVIDVKDDDGFMLFETDAASKFVPEANKRAFYTKDEIKEILTELKKQGIYVIARIVCFKDPSYARAHPDRALVYKDTGEPYMGIYKVPWASAYDRNLWEYNASVAVEAAQVGFDEIQYDYVRFPELTKENRQRINLRQVGNESFAEAIQKFLIYSKKKLEPYNIPLAVDIFGLVSTAVDDVGIGQYWEAISNVVDYVCPMIYPSHYANGSFGLSVPDAYPYETIYRALEDAIRRNLNIPTPAKIRPWLQSFTATWVKGHITYGEEEIKKQIQAARDLGIKEYMLWNASNRYNKMWYY